MFVFFAFGFLIENYYEFFESCKIFFLVINMGGGFARAPCSHSGLSRIVLPQKNLKEYGVSFGLFVDKLMRSSS